jgi:hypothetical protein
VNDQELGDRVGAVLREMFPLEAAVPAESPVATSRRVVSQRHRSPARRRSAAFASGVAVMVALVVVSLVVMLDGSSHPSRPAQPHAGQPLVSANRLAAPFSFGQGRIQLAVPPASADPKMPAQRARALGLANRWIEAGSRSEVFLAVLTSYTRATRLDPVSGKLMPNIQQRLGWVLCTQDVRQVGYGPARGDNLGGAFALLSRIIVLDADTGHLIEGDYRLFPDLRTVTVAPTVSGPGKTPKPTPS